MRLGLGLGLGLDAIGDWGRESDRWSCVFPFREPHPTKNPTIVVVVFILFIFSPDSRPAVFLAPSLSHLSRTSTIANPRRFPFSFVFFPFPFPFLFTPTQHILRLLNTNVDGRRKIMFALTEIKGVGRRYSNLVCKKADVDLNKR
jgi:hypothetical protein